MECECGAEITMCSLCGRPRFHLTTEDSRYECCAACDTMTRWPTVISDLELSRAVMRVAHPSAPRPGSLGAHNG